ncbi:MAG: c-type cytochrome [Campylobacteraceae bacterium]
MRSFSKRCLFVFFALIIPAFLFSQEAINGEDIYKKRCLGCHGPNGQTPAFGISRLLVDLDSKEMADKLKSYTATSVVSGGGVTAVMGKQTARLTKPEYDAVLKYISENFAKK